jgi:hypothetical protein
LAPSRCRIHNDAPAKGRLFLSERLENEILTAIPHASVLTHIEPVHDPAAFDDQQLDRGGI